MEGYVRSEYGNLWETHQCRPHAYGRLRPHLVARVRAASRHAARAGCRHLGFGAHLSFVEGWVSEDEMHRGLQVISDFELSLYHPVAP